MEDHAALCARLDSATVLMIKVRRESALIEIVSDLK